MFHNIRTPGQLQPTATFSLFKADVQPKWEAIPNGGAWAAMVPKGPNSKSLLDEWWKHAVRARARVEPIAFESMRAHCVPTVHACIASMHVLAAIGEQFDDYGEVCGVVVNIRPKGDRVELWTRTAANEAAQVSNHGFLAHYTSACIPPERTFCVAA
eukprot:353504-Chlamydomonas_euryale.AAC.8